jgi:hypothetical protein
VRAKYSAFAALPSMPSRCTMRRSGRLPVRPAGAQVRLGGAHVRRHRLQPAHHLPPLRLGAQPPAARVGHLLELPVHAAERLGHVRVHRALVVPPRVLAQQERQLRRHERVVHAVARVERGGPDGAETTRRLAMEGGLARERRRPRVAQPAVHVGERRRVRVAAEVGGGHRVEGERAHEVALAQGGERRGRRGRRDARRGERAEDAEADGGVRRGAEEGATVHGRACGGRRSIRAGAGAV